MGWQYGGGVIYKQLCSVMHVAAIISSSLCHDRQNHPKVLHHYDGRLQGRLLEGTQVRTYLFICLVNAQTPSLRLKDIAKNKRQLY